MESKEKEPLLICCERCILRRICCTLMQMKCAGCDCCYGEARSFVRSFFSVFSRFSCMRAVPSSALYERLLSTHDASAVRVLLEMQQQWQRHTNTNTHTRTHLHMHKEEERTKEDEMQPVLWLFNTNYTCTTCTALTLAHPKYIVRRATKFVLIWLELFHLLQCCCFCFSLFVICWCCLSSGSGSCSVNMSMCLTAALDTKQLYLLEFDRNKY